MEISKANGQMDTALANISQRTSETQASLNIQTDRSQGQEGDDGQQRGVSEKLADITKKLNEQMDSQIPMFVLVIVIKSVLCILA